MSIRKRIKILSRGPINSKYGIHGPILTAYMEEPSTIFRMISEGHKVVEVLENGTDVPLDVTNFNVDNNMKKVEDPPVVHIPSAPIVINEEVIEDEAPKKQPPVFNNKYDKRSKYTRYDEKKAASSNEPLNTQETEVTIAPPVTDTVELK